MKKAEAGILIPERQRGQRWRRRRVLDLAALAIVGCFAVHIGHDYLFPEGGDWLRGSLNFTLEKFYAPSLTTAMGGGFADVDLDKSPEAFRFFRLDMDAFPAEDGAARLEPLPATGWQRQHCYLAWLVGWTWRVFGTSWTTFRELTVGAFVVTALLLYVLLRMGAGPVLGIGGTLLFLYSPGTLEVLPNLRDFLKAPVFFAFFIPGLWLLRGRESWAGYKRAAVALGATMGLGLGFRPDILMALPPALALLALVPMPPRPRAVGIRLAGIALCLGALVVTAVPVLVSYLDTGYPSHELVVGLGTVHNEILGIKPGSYEWVYDYSDWFADATIASYGDRVLGSGVGLEPAGQAFFREIVLRFPADMATRAFASVRLILSGQTLGYRLIGGPASWVLLGPACCALALLLVSRRSMLRAGLLFIMLLYFCGYVSVQFHYRHAFHLSTMLLLAGAFLCQQAGLACLGVVLGRIPFPGAAVLRSWLGSCEARRVAGFALAGVLALTAPLWIMRGYQAHLMGRCTGLLREAEATPMTTVPYELAGWTIHRRTSWPAMGLWQSSERRFFDEEYLRADLKASPEHRQVWLRYEAEAVRGVSFSTVITLPPTGNEGETVSLYFPAYQNANAARAMWTRFSGVGLPAHDAGDFVGLHRIVDIEPFVLLPTVVLPENRGFFQPYHTMKWTGADLFPQYIGAIPARPCPFVVSLDSDGRDPATAAALVAECAAAFEEDPKNLTALQAVARAHETLGDLSRAERFYRRAVAADPGCPLGYVFLEGFMERRHDPFEPLGLWRALGETYPSAWPPVMFLAEACLAAGDKDGALDAYREALRRAPRNAAVQERLIALLETIGEAEKLVPFAKLIAEKRPKLADKGAERALKDIESHAAGGDLAATRDAAAALIAFADHRESPWKPLLPLAALLTNPGGAVDFADLKAAVEAEPDMTRRMVGLLRACVRVLFEVEEWGKGVECAWLAEDLGAGSIDYFAETARETAEAFSRSGDSQAAAAGYRAMAELAPPGSPVPRELAQRLAEEGKVVEAQAAYAAIVRKDPDAAPGVAERLSGYGRAALDTGDFEEAFGWYEAAFDIAPATGRAMAVSLGAFAAAAERKQDASTALAAYRLAGEYDKKTPEFHCGAARILMSQGKTDEAAAAYRQALEADPAVAATYGRLAEFLRGHLGADARIAEWRRLVAAYPESPHARGQLAASLLEAGKRQEALDTYRVVLEMAAGDPDLLTRAGQKLVQLGAAEEALAPLEEVFAQFPARRNAVAGVVLSAYLSLERYEDGRDFLDRCVEAHVKVPRGLRDRLDWALRQEVPSAQVERR